MKSRTFTKALELKSRFHRLIPGGCHTYAKGDDQFPEFHPPFIVRGSGCRVYDADHHEYIEYGMGLRSVTLGHAYPPVVEAAHRQMLLGANFTRPAMIELEAAEAFLEIVPGAEMVKFAKHGSDATTAAVRLARAYTGRDMVAICADHPFFSIDDWFIGATAMDAGVPNHYKELTVKFEFNNIDSVRNLLDFYPGQIACFIMEMEKHDPVDLDFVRELQSLCRRHGCLFILDEIITGFRWHNGGAQTRYEIQPDLSTFGKAMGNGFAVSALAGKKEIMELGGLYHDRERVFLLSATHGAETHALAASVAVVREYQKHDVIGHMERLGERLQKGMEKSIEEHRLQGFVGVHGFPCCLVYSTRDQTRRDSQCFRTLFLQETIKRGLLAPNLVVSFAHREEEIDQTLEIVHEALAVYRRALDEGIEKYLVGRSVQPVFRKWNRRTMVH